MSHPFTLQLLGHLRETVRSVMVGQLDGESKLKEALLSSRHRAEVMHVVVGVGEKINAAVDEATRNDWVKVCEAFYTLLDSKQ